MTNLLVNEILELIPYDGWVRAHTIASTLGIKSKVVGMIIKNNLLNITVEKIRKSKTQRTSFYYRRIKLVGSVKKV